MGKNIKILCKNFIFSLHRIQNTLKQKTISPTSYEYEELILYFLNKIIIFLGIESFI